mgnify:CR=1 FL=1
MGTQEEDKEKRDRETKRQSERERERARAQETQHGSNASSSAWRRSLEQAGALRPQELILGTSCLQILSYI